MSQQTKGLYFRALKEQGVEFEKHYREHTIIELVDAWALLRTGRPELPEIPDDPNPPSAPVQQAPRPRPPVAPVRDKDPNEMAGQRLNSKDELEPIRTDAQGRVWFQEEVQKPSVPKPRGRRVLTYLETGTKQVSEQQGDYLETFEVAGDQQARTAEVKVTLPSFQVGIYQDPRFPFRIHTYNNNSGFDLFQVQDFYGGPELVPDEVKRIYVENVLCFDIRTTVRAIQTEHRQLELAGRL